MNNMNKLTCSDCPALLGAEKYLRSPSRKSYDEPTKALLHLASWLDKPGKYVPAIKEGRLCLIKGKKFNVEEIIDFAQTILFPSKLELFKVDPKMRIEWFFAENSRDCNKLNPLSKWIRVDEDTFVPYDVKTTCAEFLENEAQSRGNLGKNQTIQNVSYDVLEYLAENHSLLPALYYFNDAEIEKDFYVSRGKPIKIPTLDRSLSPRYGNYDENFSFSPSTTSDDGATIFHGIPSNRQDEEEFSSSPSFGSPCIKAQSPDKSESGIIVRDLNTQSHV